LGKVRHLKMHVGDEGVVELRVLVDGVVAGAQQLQQLLPALERVVVVADQEADEGKLELGQDLVDAARNVCQDDRPTDFDSFTLNGKNLTIVGVEFDP
jgi:hypothetical protein